MPHPERHLDKTQRPDWTRYQNDPDFATKVGDGFAIFKNAVEYFA
jgi:phosphoribosylformylglycinamidine (FGAM) synthase-like amidotransferase family enzyme